MEENFMFVYVSVLVTVFICVQHLQFDYNLPINLIITVTSNTVSYCLFGRLKDLIRLTQIFNLSSFGQLTFEQYLHLFFLFVNITICRQSKLINNFRNYVFKMLQHKFIRKQISIQNYMPYVDIYVNGGKKTDHHTHVSTMRRREEQC